MTGKSYTEQRAPIIASPCVSYWLKGAIMALEKRDPIDALNDAELLAELARARVDDIGRTYAAAGGAETDHKPPTISGAFR